MALSMLFSPFDVKGLKLRNRFVCTPLVSRLSTDCRINERHLDFYAARASGGVALVIVEPGMVTRDSCLPINLGIFDDACIPNFSRLVDVIHSNGALAGIQIQHIGRQGKPADLGFPLVAPSPIPWSPREATPEELKVAEIQALVEKFGEAARRARQAGFDIVEVHGAHGYLVNQFLSSYSNKRSDQYGGDLAGRSRFSLEVVRCIREFVGKDFPIGFRINGVDNVPGGLTIDEAVSVSQLLARNGVDVISVSSGVFGSHWTIVPPYDVPYGCNLGFAQKIKAVAGIPVICAGRLGDPVFAESALVQGKTDLIGLGRPLLADPDLPNKARSGALKEIRRCLSCSRCEFATAEPGGIVCTVNASVGKERESQIVAAVAPKKVVVVGGGLAGMEAARVSAERGHRVTVIEEDSQLGGQWVLASAAPFKSDFMSFIDWLTLQCQKYGVRIRLGAKATARTVVGMKPQVVIVATGAQPRKPPFKIAPGANVIDAWDVLAGKGVVHDRVLIVGGSSVGLETADFLASKGKKVTVIERLGHIGTDLPHTVRFHLLKRLAGSNVEIVKSSDVREIGRDGVRVFRNGVEETLKGYDAVVLAIGVTPRSDLAGDLKGKVKELYIVGDAANTGVGIRAVRDANRIARSI